MAYIIGFVMFIALLCGLVMPTSEPTPAPTVSTPTIQTGERQSTGTANPADELKNPHPPQSASAAGTSTSASLCSPQCPQNCNCPDATACIGAGQAVVYCSEGTAAQ